MTVINAITPLQYCLVVGPWVLILALWTLTQR